jgi:hypothetical protein
MKKKIITQDDSIKIVDLYLNGGSVESICKIFKTGKTTIKNVLINNNVPLKNRGGQVKHELVTIDYSKYENKILKCKKTSKIIRDPLNRSGFVVTHLKSVYNIELPSTYKRNMITKTTGRLWYEDYFDILDDDVNKEKWFCPLCEWSTPDTTNLSGCVTKHIKQHGYYSLTEFFGYYPKNRFDIKIDKIDLSNPKTFINCGICNQPFRSISNTHLKSHNTNLEEYKIKYGQIFSDDFKDECKIYLDNGRYNIENNFISRGQKEISEYIESLGFIVLNNHKKSLNGVEIDIFIPSLGIGFEYNGLFWHSEKMGKDKNYHINKQNLANSVGIKLYHIFSDEWINKSDIIKKKIKHLLGMDVNKIYARNCIIKEIDSKQKELFLKENHIQGGDKSKYKIGAYHNGVLVAVMTFSELRRVLGSKKESGTFELVRFSSTNVVGIASKMLKYFINNYKPTKIISYADKRWTVGGNLYEKIGFKLVGETPPNYWYSMGDSKRYHRYNFRKDTLVKQGFDKNKSEKIIMDERGYLTTWDCGNYKFEMVLV